MNQKNDMYFVEVRNSLSPWFAVEGFCGFFPPQGWLDLVLRLHNNVKEVSPDYRIVQVKEKFGGLRYYVDNASESAHSLIREAEKESLTVCQNCGSRDASLCEHGWVATLCSNCIVSEQGLRGYPQ